MLNVVILEFFQGAEKSREKLHLGCQLCWLRFEQSTFGYLGVVQ